RFVVRSGNELPKIDYSDQFPKMAISADNCYLLSSRQGKAEQVPLEGGGFRNLPAKAHPLELHSLEDGQVVQSIELSEGFAGPVAFSPDSRTCATVVLGDQPHIEVRTIPDLSEIGQIKLPSRALALEFSESGRLLAASLTDSTVLIWKLDEIANGAKR